MSNVSDRQHGLSAACYLLPPAPSIGHVAVLCSKVRWPLAVLVPVAARHSALLVPLYGDLTGGFAGWRARGVKIDARRRLQGGRPTTIYASPPPCSSEYMY